MKLVIADADGHRQEVALAGEPLTIGRSGDNRVRLTEKDVSRLHARVVRDADGRVLVEDLRSLTGIRVNGERIQGPREIAEGDLVTISAYALTVEQESGVAGRPIRPGDPPSAGTWARPLAARPAPARGPPRPGGAQAKAPPAAEAGPTPLRSAEKPRLVALSEVPRARAWLIERTQVSLGRGQANDICVDHPSVALAHCTLRRTDAGWMAVPAEGISLTVNGAAPAGPLLGGDLLALGEVQLVFLAPGQPFALPASAAEGSLPQRMAPVRVAEPSAHAPRLNLRLVASVLAAMAAAAALGASAARLLQRTAAPRAAPPPSSGRDGHHPR